MLQVDLRESFEGSVMGKMIVASETVRHISWKARNG